MEMIELKVSIEAGRFDALKYFMSTRENTDPQKALEKTLEEMYEKHVPPDTREYLDSRLKPAPVQKARPKRQPRPTPQPEVKQAPMPVMEPQPKSENDLEVNEHDG